MSEDLTVSIPKWVRERFPSDQRAAVDHLRALMDEPMLKEIAEADYAKDVDGHLSELRQIWQGGELVELDFWFPMEVLELTRWSEPEDADWKPGSEGLRGHKQRAFSCAVLLATPNFEADKETLIQLVDSAFHLGSETEEAIARFLVWRLDNLGHEQDRPFFALAMIAMIQSLKRGQLGRREGDLVSWMSAEEGAERRYLSEFDSEIVSSPWMFGLSYNDMLNAKWEALILKVKQRSNGGALSQLLEKKVS